MGRITMFTREGCSHCVRAKTELEGRSLPFVEISLTDFPERRQDMMALSNRMTVPQIFFNSDSIGGADDLMAKLAEWDRTGFKLFQETYRKLVERLPDPADPRLAIPTHEEEVSEITTGYESPEEEEMMDFGCISLPNGTCAGIQEVTRRLVDRMPRQKLPYLTKFYSDCFPGSRGVDALLELYFSDAGGEQQEENRRAKAVVFGRLLQKHGVLHHVCDDHLFHDTDAYYYRLQPFHEPNVLNSAVPTLVSMQQQKEDEEPQQSLLLSPKGALKVLNKLNKLLAEIEQKASTREGIDYLAIDTSLYHRLEDYASQLQCMDPTTLSSTGMTKEERFVFWIHLYNIMNRHANLKVGIPTTSAQRGAFFTSVTYNVAGQLVTLDDVEHGILRANTRHPYHLKPQFSSSGDDPRKIWVLPGPLDPRLHFTLFCGAKSCPPINSYTPDNLEEELQIATQAFCQEDTNVSVDESTNTLGLSMIFKWYRTDFGCSSVKELPALVLSYLPPNGNKYATLKRMIEDAANHNSSNRGGIFGNRNNIKRTGSSGSLGSVGKGIRIKFLPYDWSSNAAPGKFVEFQRAKLRTKSPPSLRATFSGSASFTGGGCIPPVGAKLPSPSSSAYDAPATAKIARRQPPVKQPSTTTTTTATSSPTSTRALLTREHQLVEEDGEEEWQSLFDVEEALVTEVWV